MIEPVKVDDIDRHGSSAVTLTYRDVLTGKADQDLLYREDEPRLAVEPAERAWSMDARCCGVGRVGASSCLRAGQRLQVSVFT